MQELQGLATRWLGRSYVHLEKVDSTNNYLKANALELPHGTAVLTDYQTGGKGRLGRSWSNPKGHSLAFSLLLREDIQDVNMMLLPLLAGLAVCRALEGLCGEGFAIKWSNDVLCHEKKVCGILCESRLSANGRRPFIVIGIGINLMQSQQDFERLGLVYANSLYLATKKILSPQQVAAAVINQLEPVLETYYKQGFEALRGEYTRRCINIGRQVRILQANLEQDALAVDIAPDGSLLCRDEEGRVFPVIAGETSVRGLYGYV